MMLNRAQIISFILTYVNFQASVLPLNLSPLQEGASSFIQGDELTVQRF